MDNSQAQLERMKGPMVEGSFQDRRRTRKRAVVCRDLATKIMETISRQAGGGQIAADHTNCYLQIKQGVGWLDTS